MNRIYKIFILILSVSLAQDIDDEVTVETVDENISDVTYESPTPLDASAVYFAEHFDNPDQFSKKWVKSQAKKEGIEEEIAKYDGVWSLEPPQKDSLPGDQGLALKSKAKHAAISSSLFKPFVFDKNPLIVQYEVFLQNGQECGGAYLKLLSDTAATKDLKNFHDKTPYTIMFGPDKCGNDHKLHFIFRHKNPKNGSVEEKHCSKPKERLEEFFSDKLPHLYTLILRPDNNFEVQVDKKIVNFGNLLEDFEPPVNPPAEIDDPNDTRPEDWDEREKIPDPNAVKPDDWNEDAPAQIVDESAVMPEGWLENEPTHIPDQDTKKPADWDNDMDGEWEPPLIENPACINAPGCGPWEPPLINNPEFKGKWRPPMIDNPNYKGKWKPRRIPNPEFFEDKEPFRMHPVSAVGFELWSMSNDILFDNLIITDRIEVAEHWAAATFDKKRQKIAKDSESLVQKLANITNDYPILWALYIVVLGIPVAFVLYLCCKPSASKQQEKEELNQAAEKKKTDEVTEDNNKQVIEQQEGQEADANDEEEEEEEEEEDAEKNSNPDSEEDNEAVEDETKTGEQNQTANSEGARKRKVRKD
ncbi:calnexin-like isoform X1 [Cylas formicarius]|uniref:calnexin-like isoform X1 n=1 Tax=Cylas formicarius TaxID=197179 RepID=UPI002958A8EF|nr:calnexin-like isoform X1 [Cylas formicarius]XP_060531384.1 calnexin-like isoform X1 [Cylas formicarius]XP_060531385.1 calnexin-like isoform X1 [Cylas formicarius]